MKVTSVVAAVLLDRAGRYLLARRPEGKPYAGYWEFPGGKVEPGESPDAALDRELLEELGIRPTHMHPWISRTFHYEHAHVHLQFFRVTGWQGVPEPREGQRLAWQGVGCSPVDPVLPANGPLLKALKLPVIYGVTNGEEMGEPALLEALERAFFRGLRLVQVREKSLDDTLLSRLAEKVMRVAEPWHAQVLINGSVAVARAVGAHGVHLTAAQLRGMDVRPEMPLVAASCHSRQELAHAESLGLDFAVLGPGAPTRTHPGTPLLGWAGFREHLGMPGLPVFAIGGMKPAELQVACQAGAHGVASMRSLWKGDEPLPPRCYGETWQEDDPTVS